MIISFVLRKQSYIVLNIHGFEMEEGRILPENRQNYMVNFPMRVRSRAHLKARGA